MVDEKDLKLKSTEEDAPLTINIGNICEGAALEAFDASLAKIIANIMDQNTEAKAKREMRLVISFHPKDDRTQINCQFDCSEKLAGMIPATSKLFIGKDAEGGLHALTEDPRQMHIFTPPKPKEVPAPIEFSAAKSR